MNEEILKKLGYNNIALEMMLKREAQINIDGLEILDRTPRLNRDPSLNDLSSDVKSDIENIKNKLKEINDLLENLPEYTIKEEEYDEDVREFPTHKKNSKEILLELMKEINKLSNHA
jgi:hypothetical protein